MSLIQLFNKVLKFMESLHVTWEWIDIYSTKVSYKFCTNIKNYVEISFNEK